MIDSLLRPLFQRQVVEPTAAFITNRVGLDSNFITLLSLILGLLTAAFCLLGQVTLAILFLLLSGFCDVLDGAVARLGGTQSHIGALYDILADRFVEVAVIMALFISIENSSAILIMMMLGSVLICVTSFLVVGIFAENTSNKSFHYSAGLMERAEAFAFFIAMMIFPAAFNWLAAIFTVLVLLTAAVRVLEFKGSQSDCVTDHLSQNSEKD